MDLNLSPHFCFLFAYSLVSLYLFASNEFLNYYLLVFSTCLYPIEGYVHPFNGYPGN